MQEHYAVTVKDDAGRLMGEETFPVGTWQEIAYWLDGQGFIEPGYVIETRVVEHAPEYAPGFAPPEGEAV